MATTTTTTALDDQFKQNQNELYKRGVNIADRPYEGYTGQTVAGFNNDQLALMGDLRSNYADAQAYDPRAALAQSYTNGPQLAQQRSFLNGNVQDYMNPYVDQVIDRTFRSIDRDTDARRQQVRDTAIGQNAFGNDRRFVMEGVAEAEGQRAKMDTAANLYSQAFNTGANLMGADMDRMSNIDQANQTYLNNYNATLGRNAVLGQQDMIDARNALAGVGDSRQQLNQSTINQDVAEFYRTQGYDAEQARMLADLLYGQQVETTTTSEAPEADGSASKLGNAATAGGIAYMLGASNPIIAGAAILGGLL